MRYGASACTLTRFTRPRSMKSSMYWPPQATDSVVLMSATDSPSAAAFSKSTSTRSCGVSSWPFGRTFASSVLCAATPRNWLRAAVSASCPRPALSLRKNAKPVAMPSSGIGGGAKAKTKASLICDSATIARPATASACCSGDLRSSQFLRLTKARRVVLARAGEAEALHGEHRLDHVLFAREEVLLELLDGLQRALLGGPHRRHDLREQVALVLLRQERSGQPHEQHDHQRHHRDEHHHQAAAACDEAADAGEVDRAAAVEDAVEPAEEARWWRGARPGGWASAWSRTAPASARWPPAPTTPWPRRSSPRTAGR